MRYLDSAPPGAMDPHERIAVLDREEIDVALLYPTIGLIWEEHVADLVPDTAVCHPGQRLLDDVALPVEPRVVPAREQELARGGMGELGRAPEAAVADVEQPRHLVGALLDELRAHGARLRFVECLRDVLTNRLRVLRDAGIVSARRRGRLVIYSLTSAPMVDATVQMLDQAASLSAA